MGLIEDINAIEVEEDTDQTFGGQLLQAGANNPQIETGKNIMTGLSQALGLPKLAVDISEKVRNFPFERVGLQPTETPDFLPEQAEMQQFLADTGFAFEPGQEPQDVGARIGQAFGASALFLPLSASALVAEGASIIGSAFGGKAAENIMKGTEFGEKHPVATRAIGELGLGLTSPKIPVALSEIYNSFRKSGGTFGKASKVINKIIPGKKQRAGNRILSTDAEADLATQNITEGKQIPEFENLSTAELAGTKGAAELENTVAERFPKAEAQLRRTREKNLALLEKNFSPEGDINKTKELLEATFQKNMDDAVRSLEKIESSSVGLAAGSTIIENKLKQSLVTARKIETEKFDTFKNLNLKVEEKGSNVLSTYINELADIETGGNQNNIN